MVRFTKCMPIGIILPLTMTPAIEDHFATLRKNQIMWQGSSKLSAYLRIPIHRLQASALKGNDGHKLPVICC